MSKFKEHLLEFGHNGWPKHVGGYAAYNTINLHICICLCWLCFSQWNLCHICLNLAL